MCLCKALFNMLEIRFRKSKVCNVIFCLRQLSSPEFKYVILWVVPKATCLRRRFSQEVSSSDTCTKNPWFFTEFALSWSNVSCVLPPITQESLIFHRSFPLLMQISYVFPHFLAHCTKKPWVLHRISCMFQLFGPIATRIVGFSQNLVFCDCDATFPTFFHMFGPIAPGVLGFLQDFPSSVFWPYCAKNTGFFHRIFPHVWPYCAKMPAESVNFTDILVQNNFGL